MTVVTEISENEYIGNGVTTEFDYMFRVFSDELLVVTVTDGNGDNEKRLILNTDYRVTGINSDKGGKIILKSPLINGNKLLVARDLPAKQDVTFRNHGRFYAEIHENAFDYLTMLIQRVLGNLSLFLKRPSMLSNYFDAKKHRIANITQPRNDNNAVNFELMKSAIKDKIFVLYGLMILICRHSMMSQPVKINKWVLMLMANRLYLIQVKRER